MKRASRLIGEQLDDKLPRIAYKSTNFFIRHQIEVLTPLVPPPPAAMSYIDFHSQPVNIRVVPTPDSSRVNYAIAGSCCRSRRIPAGRARRKVIFIAQRTWRTVRLLKEPNLPALFKVQNDETAQSTALNGSLTLIIASSIQNPVFAGKRSHEASNSEGPQMDPAGDGFNDY